MRRPQRAEEDRHADRADDHADEDRHDADVAVRALAVRLARA